MDELLKLIPESSGTSREPLTRADLCRTLENLWKRPLSSGPPVFIVPTALLRPEIKPIVDRFLRENIIGAGYRAIRSTGEDYVPEGA